MAAARRRGLVAVALVLAASAAYELVLALGWISIGTLPGEDAPGSGAVMLAAVAALVLGSVLLAAGETRAAAVVLVAAAAFVAARFFTYDPYYAPTLRRMSDGRLVAGRWIVAVVLLALVTAAAALRVPRVGDRLAAVLLLVCAATALAEGVGH